jgi:hypothetical protein
MLTNECDTESDHENEPESTEVNQIESPKDEESPLGEKSPKGEKTPKGLGVRRLTGRIKKRVVDDKKVALEINAIKCNLLLAEYVYSVDAANWEKKVATHEAYVAQVTKTLSAKKESI